MKGLLISDKILSDIFSHCKECYPYEACGILAGKSGVVKKIYKMNNIEKSSVSYMMDSKEQFTVMKEIREQGLEMTAIYHSHPTSAAYPSFKDIQLSFYPDSFYLIVGFVNEDLEVRAFEIKEGKVKEVQIKTISDDF